MQTVDAGNNDETVSVYRSLEMGDKTRARKSVENAMKSAMADNDMENAQRYFRVGQLLTIEPKSTKSEIDANELLALRVVELQTAASLILSGEIVPDGIDAATIDYDQFSELVYGDKLDAETIATRAAKTAASKLARNAARHDVGAHIAHVVRSADDSVTEFLVSELHNGASPEYGDARPSSGAVFAHLVARRNAGTLDEIGVNAFIENADGKMVAIRATYV